MRRDLLNAADVVAWAKEQGFEFVMPADEMHVTVCYSKTPVDWGKFTLVVDNCIVPATAGRWLHLVRRGGGAAFPHRPA